VITPNHSFPLWDDDYNDPVMNGHNRTAGATAFDILRNWDKYRDKGRFIVWLAGPPGRGKTMLARIMATYYCILRDVDGLYVDWSAKLQEVKDGIGNPHTHVSLAPFFNVEALILDELGTEATLWDVRKLRELLAARQNRGITIVTSNHRISVKVTNRDTGVVYQSYSTLMRNPSRPKEALDSAYAAVAERILDRLSRGHHSYLWAEVPIDAPKSYRGRKA
jgi:predicted ATPase